MGGGMSGWPGGRETDESPPPPCHHEQSEYSPPFIQPLAGQSLRHHAGWFRIVGEG